MAKSAMPYAEYYVPSTVTLEEKSEIIKKQFFIQDTTKIVVIYW